jgi:hypothetical protein
MAVEQKWLAVPPQLFTADGSTLGIITVANTAGFKVKQRAVVSAVSQPDLQVQIKRVISQTQMIVGPLPESINPVNKRQGSQLLSVRSDLSAYTLAIGAYVYADEQEKAKLNPDDIWQAVYEQEPTVAIRTLQVDQWGNPYSNTNPVPVALESAITIGAVEIKGPSGDFMTVNPDGSINVNVVETPVAGQVEKIVFNEVSSVPNSVQTQVAFYTVPVGKTAVLHRVNASGDNFAQFDVFLNSNRIDTLRTWYSNFNAQFDYTTGTNSGIALNSGDILSVKVLHTRPFVGTFDARIQVLEIT